MGEDLETEGVDLGVVVAALVVVVVGLVETVIEAGALEVTEAVLEATEAVLAATEVVSEVTEVALVVTEGEEEGSGEDSEAEVTVSEVGLVAVDSVGETILVGEGASGNLDHHLLHCSLLLIFFLRGGRGGGIGYQGSNGFADGHSNGFGGPPPHGAPGGFSGPPGGGMPGGFGGSGGFRGDLKREGSGGFDERDSKRPRY